MSGPAGFAADQLKSFIDRIERLHEERDAIADDIRDVFVEAKGSGFDVKVMREVLKIRRQDKSEREEHEAVLDLYLQALGMSFGPAPDYDDEPAPRAPARAGEDVTVRIEAGGKSAEMPLSTLNKIVDGSRTEAGRAVLSAAVKAVRSGADAEVPFV